MRSPRATITLVICWYSPAATALVMASSEGRTSSAPAPATVPTSAHASTTFRIIPLRSIASPVVGLLSVLGRIESFAFAVLADAQPHREVHQLAGDRGHGGRPGEGKAYTP